MPAGGQYLPRRIRPFVRRGAGATTMDLDCKIEEYVHSFVPGRDSELQGVVRISRDDLCVDQRRDRARDSFAQARAEGRRHHFGGHRRVLRRDHTDSANTWPVGAVDEKTGETAARHEGRARGGASRRDDRQSCRRYWNAIETAVLKGGFAVVRELVGHGVGR